MGIFDRIFKGQATVIQPERAQRVDNVVLGRPAARVRHRGYQAAGVGRLENDWTTQSYTANGELRWGVLPKLRARSRDLAMNNDYAKRFFALLVDNVVGPNGIRLQMKARTTGEKLDRIWNRKVEEAWKAWGKKGVPTVCGCYSWIELQRMVIERIACDGDILLRKHLGPASGNPFGFALQVIEADQVDDTYNDTLPNGNKVEMGVEMAPVGRIVAVHVLTYHPGDRGVYISRMGRDRVPIENVIFPMLRPRVKQARGVPWMHTPMSRLNMLGKYEEAELVAARGAASKMGFITTPSGDEYTGDAKDGTGEIISEFEPGIIEQLPEGWEFKAFDPTHPAGNFGPFMKQLLRGISSGLNVSYNTLASDLESVNYSSIRAGTLSERDTWRGLQVWFAETFCEPVFSGWLEIQFFSGAFNTDEVTRGRIRSGVRWQPRGWDWVDPQKDIAADVSAIQNNLKTRSEAVGARGLDFEDIVEQLAEEERLMDEAGVPRSTPAAVDPPAGKPDEEEEEKEEDENA